MNHAFYPGRLWLDTEGKRIQAHGGSVLYHEGVYYWYGENKEHTDGKNGIWHWGVRCYSSKDLYNWEDRGLIIPPDVEHVGASLHPASMMDRPHILYNEQTKKFVCWLKIMHPDGRQTMTVMTADDILGPYTMVREDLRPLGMSAGDFDLVKAPAHFYRKGKHYLITSGTTGYLPNPSELAVADTWHGPFTVLGNPHPQDASHTSYHSQISCVFRVEAQKDLYIAMADRWIPDHMEYEYEEYGREFERAFGNETGSYTMNPKFGVDNERNTSIADYVWLPLQFEDEEGGAMGTLTWRDSWTLEEFL